MTDLRGLADKVEKIAAKLEREGLQDRLQNIGDTASACANESLQSSIGDRSLSHWTRTSPVDMTMSGKVKLSDHAVEVAPENRARGPWRIMESGRAAYAAGDRRVSGSRVSKKTGERVAKTRRVKRATSAHGGRGTWTAAVEQMKTRVPETADRDVQEILRSQFGG